MVEKIVVLFEDGDAASVLASHDYSFPISGWVLENTQNESLRVRYDSFQAL